MGEGRTKDSSALWEKIGSLRMNKLPFHDILGSCAIDDDSDLWGIDIRDGPRI
jgi:hypothetical protein